MNTNSDFEREVRRLVGLPCLGAVGGKGTGTVISIHFGDLIPLKRRSNNPHLAEVFRTHQGAYLLYIECAWRLDRPEGVLTGSLDTTRGTDGVVGSGLSEIDRAVVSELLGPMKPAGDLVVRLGKYSLNIFCDQVDLEANVDNYSLFVPDAVYVVGPRGDVRVEKRKVY